MANSGKITERGVDGIAVEAATPASQPGDVFPSGVIMAFAGSAAPTNWLICDGTAVSRSTYSALFAVIGTTYGAGDGSTTFNLPDLRGRSVVGKHTSGTFTTLGGTGGAENVTLTTAQLPVHNHSGISGAATPNLSDNENANHHHSLPTSTNLTLGGAGAFHYQSNYVNEFNFTSSIEDAAHAHTLANHYHTIPNDGSGNSHTNMQPYIVLNHIVKT